MGGPTEPSTASATSPTLRALTPGVGIFAAAWPMPRVPAPIARRTGPNPSSAVGSAKSRPNPTTFRAHSCSGTNPTFSSQVAML